MVFSGRSEEGDRMEIMELQGHPFFMGCQFHPELVTKPLSPAPLYLAFFLAACGSLQPM
jgi:CTP synthase